MLKPGANKNEQNSITSFGSMGIELHNLPIKEQAKIVKMSRMKKEKSRDAARSRRGKENYEFYELAKLLPIPNDTSSQLDKASIVRLTMSYLQLQEFFHTGSSFLKPKKSFVSANSDSTRFVQKNLSSLTLQSLDGFLFVLNKKGRCLYVSSSISVYLGLAQVDLIGTSIYNFVHQSDHAELSEHLKNTCCEEKKQKFCRCPTTDQESKNCTCSFFVRMKSTLTRRGMTVKSSGYKVVHITGCICHKNPASMVDDDSSNDEEEEPQPRDTLLGFAGMVHVLPPPLVDIRLDEPMFITRLDRSLRVTYCEERIEQLTDYEASDIRGSSIYQFIHVCDVDKIRTCHIEILNKGQVVTPYYRWLLRDGTCIWVQSCVALLLDKHQCADEDTFVWITYVLSQGNDFIPVPPICEDRATVDNHTSPRSDTKKELVKPSRTCIRSQSESALHDEPFNGAATGDAIKGGKLTKQIPERNNKLKRVHSANSYCATKHSDDQPLCREIKRERLDESEQPLGVAISEAKSGGGPDQSKAGDVLDADSTMWYNPPNRVASNQSDLRTTVIHHHYPYGIDPNLLNSNPVFAKMLTANYVSYESLFASKDAFILTQPVNFLAPMLNTIPSLLPTPRGNVAYCPPSVATIIDELRKDPMRKISPPNKVILPCSRAQQSEDQSSNADPASTSSPGTSQGSLPRSVLALSDVSANNIFLAPLGSFAAAHGANGPLILQPLKLAQNIGALNSLPI